MDDATEQVSELWQMYELLPAAPFRPLTVNTLPYGGDQDRYLVVYEPTLGHIAGKAFSISHSFMASMTPTDCSEYVRKLTQAACYETMARARAGQWVPEGSEWEAFR